MVPCTNQQLRISRIKVNLVSGLPCLNFCLACGQQSNRLLQGSVTNLFFRKHYEKKNVLEKSVKCSVLSVEMVLKLEQNTMFNSHFITAQQKHIIKSQTYIYSGGEGEAFSFCIIYIFSLHHTQVLQMKYFVLFLMFPFVPWVCNHRWTLAATLQLLARCNGEKRFKDMKGRR